MGALANIVDTALGGNDSGSSLQDFLSKFSSSSGNYANIIDPYSQFNLTMKFYPVIDKKEKKSTLDKLLSAGQQAA